MSTVDTDTQATSPVQVWIRVREETSCSWCDAPMIHVRDAGEGDLPRYCRASHQDAARKHRRRRRGMEQFEGMAIIRLDHVDVGSPGALRKITKCAWCSRPALLIYPESQQAHAETSQVYCHTPCRDARKRHKGNLNSPQAINARSRSASLVGEVIRHWREMGPGGQEIAVGHLMARLAQGDTQPHCPRPDKIAWLTREGAEAALESFRGRRPGDSEIGTYECVCGAWHLGYWYSPEEWSARLAEADVRTSLLLGSVDAQC